MNYRKRSAGEGQLEMPFAPVVSIPTIVVPTGDGTWTLRAGKPVVESNTVGTRRAAKLLNLSMRRVQSMCDEGLLEHERPGGPRGHYRILLASIQERKGKPAG